MNTIYKDKKLREALYSIYLAQFKAFKACPDQLNKADATRMLTSLMGSKPWSWRVVGITPAALEVFKEHHFEKPKEKLLQRGHIYSRSSTAEALLRSDEPRPLKDFFDFFLERDKTVIGLTSENPSRGNHSTPCYYPIDLSSELFPCGSLIGWKQGEKEATFLRALYEARHKAPRSCGWPQNESCPQCKAVAAK
ncbi:hypothetical protein [Cupriavidus malaysiensis]|uniref:4Fe4S-binding SPASM domain-containing protein n=1 Tax=Cupriavidus malaysiensis TaxID=367825 RepID=A0ABM6F5D9_9BURK|nr:hypothetical protein [Cupriavidus malaysiensis]AOZ06717.1 hypothetical protein BKK80_13510 [Cupriavidus malaysiensis]